MFVPFCLFIFVCVYYCLNVFSMRSNAHLSFSSLAQSDILMYLSPLEPNMNPGVMNTRAS